MTDDIDFYDLLKVDEDASQDDIKSAFREQVRVYHPDLNDDDRAQAQFTALKKAYDILGDPVERQAYDRLGHEDYVAKRTSGLPSPDLWKRSVDSDGESDADGSKNDTRDDGRSTAASGAPAGGSSSSTGAGGSGRRTTGGRSERSAAGSASGSGRTVGGRSRSTASGSDGSTTTAGATAAGTAGTSTASSATSGTTASGHGRSSDRAGATTATTSSTTQSTPTTDHSRPGPLTNNAFVRWWRNQNFAWPLIWTSVLVYVAGLGHFALVHEGELSTLVDELAGVGTDPNGLWAVLTESRHGLDTALAFITAVDLVEPPLEQPQWYGALAGLIALSLVVVIAARVAWRGDTWGAVSIDETMVVAIALTVAMSAVGGPLLAGVVLMPLLFGVVLYRTSQLPGWSPSFVYALLVSTPLSGLAVNAAGYATLVGDLLLFVVLPLLGAIGLQFRVTLRKHFGR